MKAAYHFDADHPKLGGYYGPPIQQAVLRGLSRPPRILIGTKVFAGDLLLHNLAADREVTNEGTVEKFNNNMYLKLVEKWLVPDNPIWRRYGESLRSAALQRNIFVICFESISDESATALHGRLGAMPWYLGAMEVDDSSPVHWEVYSHSLIPMYRLAMHGSYVFWNGLTEDSKDQCEIELLEQNGFSPAQFEPLNGRYTIFDAYHDFEHGRRVAIWKRRAAGLLGYIADEVVSRLGDTAPDLADKLYGALKTFDSAETTEELAQVMASCRRIFEYVTDCIFPPTDKSETRHNLGSSKYKNRLLAYADQHHASETNVNLVAVSVDVWKTEVEKLCELANKGVHAEVYRAETRRCLLRTILLLDDIAALRSAPFEMRMKLDEELLRRMFKESD